MVELYGVWDGGNESFDKPPEAEEDISVDRLLDSNFRFKEQGFYRVSGETNHPIRANSLEVVVLYRKREWAECGHEHGGIARFRYSDLKEAARGCGGRVLCKFN